MWGGDTKYNKCWLQILHWKNTKDRWMFNFKSSYNNNNDVILMYSLKSLNQVNRTDNENYKDKYVKLIL